MTFSWQTCFMFCSINHYLFLFFYYYLPFVDFVGILAGDDNLTAYADGRLVGHNGGIWKAARWFSFSSNTRIIAVSVLNIPGHVGGFLGVFSNGIVTDNSWKCKETYSLENGWEKNNFTDDAWPYAYIREKNNPVKVDGIPSNVHWISPANHYALRIICRRHFSTEERNNNSSKLHLNTFIFSFRIPAFKLCQLN